MINVPADTDTVTGVECPICEEPLTVLDLAGVTAELHYYSDGDVAHIECHTSQF